MLVNDWVGGQQLEDNGKEEVLPPLEVFSLLEETKTVNSNFDFKEKDQKKAQETNAKAEMITSENFFIDNNDRAGPSSLAEGKTANSNMEKQMENALYDSQKSDAKAEMDNDNGKEAGPSTLKQTENALYDIKAKMVTESPVFDNNDGGKEAVPSSLDEGRTGKREERTRRIKSGILWNTPKWT